MAAERSVSSSSSFVRSLNSWTSSPNGLLSTTHQSPETEVSDAFRDRYLRMVKPISFLHLIMFVEVVNMTNNTQFKTLLNTWLNHKKPMITPSTHASFTLIAENHLIPHFGKRKIGSITESGHSELHIVSLQCRKVGQLRRSDCKDNQRCYSRTQACDGVCVQRTGDTLAQLGFDWVPKRARGQESSLLVEGSGASPWFSAFIWTWTERLLASWLRCLPVYESVNSAACRWRTSLADKTISINKTVQRIYDKKRKANPISI